MPTIPEPAAPPFAASKWWAHSLTIWGAIITTLATVLPTLGALLGLDITPDLVRQLGDQVVALAQAIATLIGTILTIYGRLRATTPLARRAITMRL